MNVILVSLDTLRAQNMSLYGYSRLTTPHLDRLAANGTVFNQCFSTHIPTHPGHTCMMTGKDAFTTQIVCQGGAVELDPKHQMLAEILQEQGYFTAAADNLGRWFSRGFDEYRSYRWETDPRGAFRKAEAVNAVALDLLNRAANQDRPFFLFLHYWDPHTPYKAPEPFKRMFYQGDPGDPNNRSMDALFACAPFTHYFRQWMFETDRAGEGGMGREGEPETAEGVKGRQEEGETKRLWTDLNYAIAQYDAEIAYLDATIAALFTRLRELKLENDTLLVITADHGEELHEHELWFDHHGLYDTNVWIPMILYCPGTIPAGKRVNGFARLLDTTPTILDFLGIGDLSKRNKMDGKSLRPLLKRSAKNAKGVADALFCTECTWMKKKAVRTQQWKLILEWGGTPAVYHKPAVELYDLVNDRDELVNVANDRPEIVAELKERLHQWIAARKAKTKNPDPHDYQDLTLRQIGKLETAIPRDQKLVELPPPNEPTNSTEPLRSGHE